MPKRIFVTSLLAVLLLAGLWSWSGYRLNRKAPSAPAPATDIAHAVPIPSGPEVLEQVSVPREESTPETAATPLPTRLPAAKSYEHFAPWTKGLVRAVEAGRPVDLKLGDREQKLLLYEVEMPEQFQVALGSDQAMETSLRLFNGMVLAAGDANPLQAVSMAVVGHTVSVSMEEPDGSRTHVLAKVSEEDPDHVKYWTQNEPAVDYVAHDITINCEEGCSIERVDEQTLADEAFALLGEGLPLPDGTVVMAYYLPPDDDPSLGGNDTDRSTVMAPWGPRYAGSLKKVRVFWVCNKNKTGANTTANLENKASELLAVFGHNLAIFEHQVGFRLELQELVLIPADPSFTSDFAPTSTDQASILVPLNNWLKAHRPQGTYKWQIAVGIAGLPSGGGIGFWGTFPGNLAICAAQPTVPIVAHEMGHVFGSYHTTGGIMGSASGYDFYTPHLAGYKNPNGTPKTPVDEMYALCNTRGSDTGVMRHPAHAPFAFHDKATTAIDTPVTFNPLGNDKVRTKAGVLTNGLTVEEVGGVYPPGAGTFTYTEKEITVTPTAGFEGVVWTTYSLAGDQGNGG